MTDSINIAGKDWKLVVTRNMSHWHNILSLRGHAFNTKDFCVNVPCRWLYLTVDATKTSVFMELENLAEYSTAVMEAFITKKKVSEIKNKYKKIGKGALKALEKVNADLDVANWEAFMKAYQKLTPGLMITTNFGRGGAEELIRVLEERGIDEREIPQIIALITYPDEHTPLLDSQVDLMKIGEKVQAGKISDKKIEEELWSWLNKWGAIPVNFCDEPWNMNDARSQLDFVLKKDCSTEIKRLEREHKQKIKEKTEILKKLNDNKVETLADALAEATCLNEFRKNIFCKLSLGYRPIFSKIAKLGGSENWRDIFYLLPEETITLLNEEKIFISEIVKKRRLAGAYMNENNEEIILDEAILKRLEDYVKSTHSNPNSISGADSKSEIIKGFSASKGLVKGIARIILNSLDFDKLKPGEILVTTMTSVDFVPVMARAAAFVTNEGGITSHASIAAREMNKPCVIGTKNATQVIKDGDLVEVDANQGIVKIIK